VGATARAPPVSARAAVGANHADSSQVDSSQVGSRRRASRLGSWDLVCMCVCEVFVYVVECARFSSWHVPGNVECTVWFGRSARRIAFAIRSDPRLQDQVSFGRGDLGRNS
jgi:hypothetical protein